MNCPNCQTEVPANEQFCPACGTELASADASVAITTPTDAGQTAAGTDSGASAQPALATLMHNSTNIALHEGSEVIIAREGTDKCAPDLAINSDKVSGSPVTVRVSNGTINVHASLQMSVGIRIVKYIPPGGEMAVIPGDMLMLGDEVVMVG